MSGNGPSPRLQATQAIWMSGSGGAVDALAQQVGMSGVPGVFLDHVQIHPAQRHLPPPVADEDLIQGRPRGRAAGQVPLRCQACEVRLGTVRAGLLERRIGPVLAPAEAGQVLAPEPAAKSRPLHLGIVTHQPEQRQPRRRHRPRSKLPSAQPRALPQQRRPLPLQETLQHGPLTGHERLIDPGNLRRDPAHHAMIPGPGAAIRTAYPARLSATFPFATVRRRANAGLIFPGTRWVIAGRISLVAESDEEVSGRRCTGWWASAEAQSW